MHVSTLARTKAWWLTTALHTMESFISTGAVLLLYLPPLQPLRQMHYPLISRTWPFIKLGHVKQSHRAVFYWQPRLFSFFSASVWLWLNVIIYPVCSRVWIYVRKVCGRELPFSLYFLSLSLSRACICYMLGVLKEQDAHSTTPKTTAIRSNGR